jgi:hypothetical protein
VITAGIIDIMSDVVVRTDLAATEEPDYTQGIWFISLGLLIAFIGRIVFDILRERITEEDSSSDEKLTIDE